MRKIILLAAIAVAITAAIAAGFHHVSGKIKKEVAAVKSGNIVTVCIDGNLSIIDIKSNKVIKQGGRCKVQIIELWSLLVYFFIF